MMKKINWRLNIRRGIWDFRDIDKSDLGYKLMMRHNSHPEYTEHINTLCVMAYFIGAQIRRQGLSDADLERCITYMNIAVRPHSPGFIFIPGVPVYHPM